MISAQIPSIEFSGQFLVIYSSFNSKSTTKQELAVSTKTIGYMVAYETMVLTV
jgi:hypothetical protein